MTSVSLVSTADEDFRLTTNGASRDGKPSNFDRTFEKADWTAFITTGRGSSSRRVSAFFNSMASAAAAAWRARSSTRTNLVGPCPARPAACSRKLRI